MLPEVGVVKMQPLSPAEANGGAWLVTVGLFFRWCSPRVLGCVGCGFVWGCVGCRAQRAARETPLATEPSGGLSLVDASGSRERRAVPVPVGAARRGAPSAHGP